MAGTPPVQELSGLSLTTDPSSSSSTITTSQPEPMMQLRTIKGLTAAGLLHNPLTDEVAFAAGALVVVQAAAGGAQTQHQRVLAGHDRAVSCLALCGQGNVLASGQEGKQPTIRLWDWSSAHASSLVALDVSADGRALIACGNDTQGRQVVALWGISGIAGQQHTGHAELQVQLLVRHTSTHDVRALRFSPLEPDQFVTVGRESIRCYRMLRGEVRGLSVRLQAPVTPSGTVMGGATLAAASGPGRVFTHVAFDAAASGLQLPARHMFVAAANGAVFQVDLCRRVVAAVYELHPVSAPISALAVGEGLALSACSDGTLRLWPLDFAAPLLEAVHDAPITSACLAGSDGLTLLTAGEDGCLGRLDVLAQTHACLLHSHRAAVTGITAHPTRPVFATVAADGSVRVWDACSHQQLHEVCSSGRLQTVAATFRATCAAFSPSQAADNGRGLELAVGTDDGCVRVLDAATGRLLQEWPRQHDGPVAQLVFTPDGARLLSCGAADGRVVAYAVRRAYGCLPIKLLTTTTTNNVSASSAAAVCAAASLDGHLLAVGQSVGGEGACLLLCDVPSLEVVTRIELAGVRCITQLGFAATEDGDGPHRLWALVQAGKGGAAGSCSSSSLLCMDAASGQLLRQLDEPHGHAACSAFCTHTGRVLVTCGADGLLKLWQAGAQHDAGPAAGPQPAPQSFSAHLGAVTAAAMLLGSLPQLASGGVDGTVCIWQLTGAAAGCCGKPQQLLLGAACASMG